jgi:hypothetical protein
MAHTMTWTFDQRQVLNSSSVVIGAVAERVGMAKGWGMVSGVADITVYDDASTVELTCLTGCFREIKQVLVEGITDAGYLVRWNSTSKTFVCYKAANINTVATTGYFTITQSAGLTNAHPTYLLYGNASTYAIVATAAAQHSFGITAASAVTVATPSLTEAGAVDVGAFRFIAYGLI